MNPFVHACPHCLSVGKVHRSLPRNFREKMTLVLFPVYGVYRCHHCNWRGWLPRGSTSPTMRRVLIALYSSIVVALLAYATLLLIERWPEPSYEYPASVE